MSELLTLFSHTLCPYVQRAVIALTEKRVPFERRYVDLSNKPAWFLRISPLGKTPVLQIGDEAIGSQNLWRTRWPRTCKMPLVVSRKTQGLRFEINFIK